MLRMLAVCCLLAAMLVCAATALAEVAYPQQMEADVPKFPQSSVMFSQKTPEAVHVMLTTAEPLAKVMDFYLEAMKTKGWEVQSEMDMGGSRITQFSKGERTFTVSGAANDAKGNMVTLILTR